MKIINNNNAILQVSAIREQQIDEIDKNLAIAWTNLTAVKKLWFSKQDKIILNKINGQINFGELTALMGPSGAGKTMLLHYIMGLNQSELTNDSKFYVSKSKPICSCFIVQNEKEHLLVRLTVKESLMYSSQLKNHRIRKYKFNHEDHIEKIIIDMLLNECKDNLVGQCSGGEQKRLSIAMELTSILKPNLLCIDEPTSGLDSHAAEKVNYFK